MTSGAVMPRVFLEPRIEPHDPGLYSFECPGQCLRATRLKRAGPSTVLRRW
jgi:hypothetical protein